MLKVCGEFTDPEIVITKNHFHRMIVLFYKSCRILITSSEGFGLLDRAIPSKHM